MELEQRRFLKRKRKSSMPLREVLGEIIADDPACDEHAVKALMYGLRPKIWFRRMRVRGL